MVAFNCQRQDEHVYYNGSQNQSNTQNSLTPADIRNWLPDQGVRKNEMDRKPTKFLPDMYYWKHFRSLV